MGGARGRLAKWRSAGIIFIVAAATGCGDPDPATACPLVRGWRRGTGGARGQLSSAARLGAGTAWRHNDGIKERGRLDGTSGRVLSAGMIVNTCRVLVLEGEFLDVICSAIVLHGAVRINDELLQFKTRFEWY